MEPREKMKQLLDKFGKTDLAEAKDHVSVCVDEIISVLEEKHQQLSHNPYSKEVLIQEGLYWQQVKNQLLTL